MTARLALDTNTFRSLTLRQLDQLADRGFRLSVSETAIAETWARSVTDHRAGKSRAKARGQFFGRARNVRHYIDESYPIALTGSHALDRVRQLIVGSEDPKSESARVAEKYRRDWGVLSGIGYSDEEWLTPGLEISAWLDELDENLFSLARPAPELLTRVDEDLREQAAKLWELPRDEALTILCHYLAVTCWDFDASLIERFDAHVRVNALRLYEAGRGAQLPKVNDGADIRLGVHLGEGFVLLTGDQQLVKLVDASGTVQAPWVRRFEDLEVPLPEGPPWGPGASVEAAAFRRPR